MGLWSHCGAGLCNGLQPLRVSVGVQGSVEAGKRERTLLAALAADLDGAFETLVARYQHRLFGCAYHLLGDAGDAEEAAQDAFVRAYRALARYGPERIGALALRPWLYRILLNVVRNRVRRKSVPRVPLERHDGTPLELADRPWERPEAVVERAEAARGLAAAIAALPERLRSPLTLRHIDGLTYAEIAEILRQPLGTVKVYVHRGVGKLREALNAAEVS
ncbi:sigma-70 family RNA polymerase sigma factor [bacterium]|nr:MAG: sigma-70 family RNA polymerase sigma factor [bacterium]